MHTCHRTILSQIVCILPPVINCENIFPWQARLLIFQMFDYPKIGKNVNFGSDTHISYAKMNRFITFGPDIFAYLKKIGVQIKEKNTL